LPSTSAARSRTWCWKRGRRRRATADDALISEDATEKVYAYKPPQAAE
jgi:hypothetical protein